ncbi:serine/threonine-protein kinase Nek1 isoform X2 [Genypterus blacodes]|uniref:serine/threonine-protein kinase Nek1 isoform X2 n=1 Tax=Genypterus blacodes TaxID=154954 RepID=UPI003F75DF38
MDKYEKVKQIGEGSFGKAILVRSKEDGRHYVIKEIGISGMSSRERQESGKEVAVLANMSHPNIVQYKESFEEGGCLYIVMDYCEGGDLFKKINSQKGSLFSEEQILNWFVQICLALKHVHDRKILHRDIKSQNIFLTKDGTVQLGDFGIARVLNSTVELARTCIGTPYYLSPEICENKPYNNKSDIWALGCVLYEMCTLKHAFEAGNMKNLVLKIIRGSYPPVSVHYSQDLRSLLGQLFKRSPRERPSVCSILDKPFLSCRIHTFLPPQIIAQEFHHAFLHKQPKVCVPQSEKRPGLAVGPPPQKVTKPAAKYGVPLVRKVSDGAKRPADRKPALKQKAPPPTAPQRRVSQVEEQRRKHEDGMRKKRMELIEKERKQREQMFLLKAEQMKRYEKEKINRINQAREQGWKHVLSSSGGSSPERKCFVGGRRPAGVGPGSAQASPASTPSRSPYERYYAALDQMAKPQPKDAARARSSAGGAGPARGVPAPAGPVLPNGPAHFLNADVIKRELQRLQQGSNPAHISRQRGHMGAERAYQVEEFLQRRREAMINKVRAEGQLGARHHSLAAVYGSRAGLGRCKRAKANKEEEEYLARLRQIRLQNFNERQQIKARLRGEKCDSDGSDSQESSEEAELRRKKIEALKAQANARAAVLKEQLEKRRKEAYEREKRAWEEHLAAQGVTVVTAAGNAAAAVTESPQQPGSSDPEPQTSSQPSGLAFSMTAALKNVGATPLKEHLPQQPEPAELQSEKKQILRRLNENLKAQSPGEEETPPPPGDPGPGSGPQEEQGLTDHRPASGGDRKKWEVAEVCVLSVAQQTLEETRAPGGGAGDASMAPVGGGAPSGGDRKKWEAGDPGDPDVLSVAQQTLEETCMRTSGEECVLGEVIQMIDPPRKVWGPSPASQVLRVLQEAELQPDTQQLDEVSISEEERLKHAEPEPSRTPDQVSLRSAAGVQTPEDQEEAVTDPSVSRAVDPSVSRAVDPSVASPPRLPDALDPSEVESMVLREFPPPALQPPCGVQEAWKQEAQLTEPPGGSMTSSTNTQEAESRADRAADSSGSQPAEPLFLRVCSPAHRRTAALCLLSAQSSVDDSSSSLASRSRSVSPRRSKNQSELLIGLSTGMFDANNPKMLRTCSLPDLSRLFSSRQNSVVSTEAAAAPEDNLEIEDLDEAAKDEDQSEPEDAYEDEDLRDIRASMERLLQEDQDLTQTSAEDGAGDLNGNTAENQGQEAFNRINAEMEQDSHQMAVDDDDDDDDEEEEGDDDEEEEEGDEEEECSNGSRGEEETGGLLTNGVGEENHSSDSQLDEEWQSDGSGEDEEGEAEHQDSIFSRLEELRFNLEQQIGFEKFIEVYNKIKAIHEDEDEAINLGSSLLLSILGVEHQHLYPSILHLVMADGAYQEDNDE